MGSACAISILSQLIVYLQNASPQGLQSPPWKIKQLRTVIFMEIMKQVISEWIYSLLGSNPSAAGGVHSSLPAGPSLPAPCPRVLPRPGLRRGCVSPRADVFEPHRAPVPVPTANRWQMSHPAPCFYECELLILYMFL